jgi:penicillin-binding protein 1A
MREIGYLTEEQYAEAQKAPLAVKRDIDDFKVHGEYVAEMVRQMLHERYPDDVYSRGFRVYTTIRKDDQEAAYAALRRGLLDYDKRHGYRGPEGYADLGDPGEGDESYEEALFDHPDSDDIYSALVLDASQKEVKAWRRGGETVSITGDGLKFAGRMLEDKAAPNKRIRRGAIIRIAKDEKGRWQILQLPEAEAAFISVSPQDGAVRSLIGGFDFNRNKFNHVTQAWRQPGSGFTTRRSWWTPPSPAGRSGSRKTTTASTKARCACARRSPSPRTWCRSASFRRSDRPTPNNSYRVSALNQTSTRLT